MAQGPYQFPVMSVGDAVEFINDQVEGGVIPGPAIKESDVRSPDALRCRQIYEGLYDHITTVPFETVFQRHRFHIGETVMYPEIHEDNTRLVLFSLAMGRLLTECGLPEFHLKDLVKPTFKHFLRVVSALTNFCRFRHGRLEVFNQLKEDVERRNIYFSQLKKDNDEMRKKINALKAAEAEKEPHIAELQTKIREVNDRMKGHYKSEARLQKRLSRLKATIAERKASSDQLRIQIMEEKKKGEQLSSQIVRSPERFKEEQKRKQGRLSQLKKVKETRRERKLELHQQMEGLKMQEEDADEALKIIQGIETEEKKEKEFAADVKKIEGQIQSAVEGMETLHTKEEELDRQILSKQEKIAKLSLQHQHKMASTKETLSALVQQVECQRDQHTKQEELERQMFDQKLALDKELNSIEQEHKGKMDKMKSCYSEFLEVMDNYNMKLCTAWNEAHQINDTTK